MRIYMKWVFIFLFTSFLIYGAQQFTTWINKPDPQEYQKHLDRVGY